MENNVDILDREREEIWNIVIQCQPPRSPDLNVLDLRVLNSLQSVQYETESHTTGAILDAVERAF